MCTTEHHVYVFKCSYPNVNSDTLYFYKLVGRTRFIFHKRGQSCLTLRYSNFPRSNNLLPCVCHCDSSLVMPEFATIFIYQTVGITSQLIWENGISKGMLEISHISSFLFWEGWEGGGSWGYFGQLKSCCILHDTSLEHFIMFLMSRDFI